MIHPNLAGIPAELKQYPQWILWCRTEDKENNRFGKRPCNEAGFAISATDSRNWLPFDTAVAQFKRSKHASGIGICLSGEPIEGSGVAKYLVGIDIDECVLSRTDTGEATLAPRAADILKKLDTYWELSPSGTGVRAFLFTDYKPTSRNRNGFELYAAGRFLTVTGWGTGELSEVPEASLRAIQELMFGPTVAASPTTSTTTPPIASVPETPENIAKLQAALDAIPAGIGREQWVRAVLSVKAHGFSCGEAMARKWSESAGPYDPMQNRNGYDAKAFDNVWRCSPKSISPGTVYFLAKQYGTNAQTITYGDTFNGRVFAELNRGHLLYVYPVGRWLRWNEERWVWCKGSEALDAAKQAAEEVLRRSLEEFKKDPSSAEARRKVTHAQQSFNLNRLESMQICGAAEDGMHVGDISELDADPMLLGCQNGVIDLRTGARLWPQREMLITKQVAADYVSDAPCPQWEQFLQQVTLEDTETIDYLQKAVGYTLSGLVYEELLHFAYGGGRNGKSVFANILRRLFNDYAVVAPAEMLMQRDRSGGANNDVARLVAARLLLANETRSGQAMDDLLFKTLVSTEAISARFLHKEYFEFKPTHHIWMRGNHKPLIRDESEGAWRRIRLVPFELDLAPDEVDPHLEEKLWTEREGILAWAVRGCIRWQKEGLTPSPRIKAASATYRKDCDLFGEFIEELCVLDKSARISQRILWEEYQQWCEDNGVKSGSKKTFTRRLEDRGVVAAGWRGRDRLYSGIRQRTAADNVEITYHNITGLGGDSGFSSISISSKEKPGNTPSSCEPVAEGGGV